MTKKVASVADRISLQEQIARGELPMGKAIRALRKQVGLTQPKLATLAGVYERVLLDIENENGNPTVETLNKILNKFGYEVGIVKRRSRDA